MLKRGLKLWSINTENYLPEAIKLYRAGFFDYIELFVVPDSLETLPKWKELINLFSYKKGIPFIIHNAHFIQGFNLALKEKEGRNREIYEQTKQFADELNAKYIIFHGGMEGEVEEAARQLKSFNEPRAIIENKPYAIPLGEKGYTLCRGYNFKEIEFIKNETGCGFCLDFGHGVCAYNGIFSSNLPKAPETEAKSPYEYVENFLKLNPDMFHLTDLLDVKSPFDSHPHLGMGTLDIEKCLKMVPNGASITFETVKSSKENLDDFMGDMKWLEERGF